MIHHEHPFPEERDPVRRFRGRLAAGVTVITAGSGPDRTGLTVSSLVVADGEPATVLFLCGHNADLGDAIAAGGGFVVHLLDRDHAALADRFAGIRPSPGGLFAGIEVTDGRWGPVLTALPARVACSYAGRRDLGWYHLVEGRVEETVLGVTGDPLLRHRGGYHGLAD